MEQTALRAPRTTGATGWGARGPGQTFEQARSTKVGDGLVPVRMAIRIGTQVQPLFMALWVPESGMRDFQDAHRFGRNLPKKACFSTNGPVAWII